MRVSESTIEALFEDISPNEARKYDRNEHTTMSLWIPKEAKSRYRSLPASARLKISERLKELFLGALDVVESKARAS